MHIMKIAISSLTRRHFLRWCIHLAASIFLFGAWPFKSIAKGGKNPDVLFGKAEFEMSFKAPHKNVIYAGIGPCGQQSISQIPSLLKGDKYGANPMDETPLTPALFTHLSDQINDATAIVHMIYDPGEVSFNDVRALQPTSSDETLYHHLHITSGEEKIEPPLSMNESVTLIPRKNIESISQQNNGDKLFTDQSVVYAWMIKTHLRLFQPLDYRYDCDLLEYSRGTLNYLSCAYHPETSYTVLINEALNRLRDKLQISSTRLLTACFGGEESSLTMEAFDAGSQHLYALAHDDCNAYNGIYLSNQSDHARWVVISAQKNINAPG